MTILCADTAIVCRGPKQLKEVLIELRKNNVETKGIGSSPSVTWQEASASVAHLCPESTSIKNFALKSFGSNKPDSGVREYIHKRANIDDLAQMIRNTLDAER